MLGNELSAKYLCVLFNFCQDLGDTPRKRVIFFKMSSEETLKYMNEITIPIFREESKKYNRIVSADVKISRLKYLRMQINLLISSLTFTTTWANSADDKLIFFLYLH